MELLLRHVPIRWLCLFETRDAIPVEEKIVQPVLKVIVGFVVASDTVEEDDFRH